MTERGDVARAERGSLVVLPPVAVVVGPERDVHRCAIAERDDCLDAELRRRRQRHATLDHVRRGVARVESMDALPAAAGDRNGAPRATTGAGVGVFVDGERGDRLVTGEQRVQLEPRDELVAVSAQSQHQQVSGVQRLPVVAVVDVAPRLRQPAAVGRLGRAPRRGRPRCRRTRSRGTRAHRRTTRSSRPSTSAPRTPRR